MTAGAILESILEPLTEGLSPEAARRINRFAVDQATQAGVSQLADKARSGTIDETELREYRELIEAFDLVAILKSKARQIEAEAN